MTLFSDFLTNQGRQVFKWTHYFPIYERHFAAWKNKSLFFLEIGVLQGGSLEMWQRYFGPYTKVVGIDIKEKYKAYEGEGRFIRIGDQSDPRFLQEIIDEFGVPDIVLDDGSHQMRHVNATFDFLYPKMGKNGIYMIEDMQTCYWKEYGGGNDVPNTLINRSKGFIDELHAHHSRGEIEETEIGKSTFAISFYDSIVVFEKGDLYWRQAIKKGRRNA